MSTIDTVFATDAIWGQNQLDFHGVRLLGEHDYKYAGWQSMSTNTDVRPMLDGWELQFQNTDMDGMDVSALYKADGFIAFVRINKRRGDVSLTVHGETEDTVHQALTFLFDKCEPIKVDPKSTAVPVQFWYRGQHGPTSLTRNIEANTWDEINGNYSHEVRDKLKNLLDLRPPFDGGKLILMHGPPGTGKTHLIRTLIRTWAPWCDANYVGDTEHFFGSTGDLLNLVLTPSSRTIDLADFLDDDGDTTEYALNMENRFRLFIMEDTDEFLQADAKTRTGQAMSRLLNLADGLIGQGLNALFLITTNEDIASIHEAVRRPGRALANISFDKLSYDEAQNWLKEHDGDPAAIHEATSVAELYDLRREQQHIRQAEEPDGRTGLYL